MLNLLRRVLDFFREESARLESLLEEGRREPLVRAIRLVESAVRRTDLPASTRERVIAQLREIRQQADSLPGTLRFAVALAALVRDLYLEIRIHSPNAKPAVKALHAARLAGCEVLPEQGDLLDTALTALREMMTEDATSVRSGLKQGRELARRFAATVAATDICPPDAARTALEIADWAYGDPPVVRAEALPAEQLPGALRETSKAQTGLMDFSQSMRIWCGRTALGLTVAFSGTRANHLKTLSADVEQLFMPSLHYLAAAGVVRLFLREFAAEPLWVVGHSLGGGLAQFAVAAQAAEDLPRLRAVAFNAAGLSLASLNVLGEARMAAACGRIAHFTTYHDPVSAFGGLLGAHLRLPAVAGHDGHGIADVRASLQGALPGAGAVA